MFMITARPRGKCVASKHYKRCAAAWIVRVKISTVELVEFKQVIIISGAVCEFRVVIVLLWRIITEMMMIVVIISVDWL